MRDYLYVWSGSLTGIPVDADTPVEAVTRAVYENLPCVLGPAIRVSLKPKGAHPLDVFYEAPYDDLFPDIFSGDLDVRVSDNPEDWL